MCQNISAPERDISLRLLFLEPFFGGSHKDFARGITAHSSHDIHLLTLPAAWWKCRMTGAAYEFWHRLKNPDHYDGIIVTDMMNLSDFYALARGNLPPVILYFHENQMTYPAGRYRGAVHFSGAVNISSARLADRVLFNSRFHMDGFMDRARTLLTQCPDMDISHVHDDILQKSSVIYPGCDFPEKMDQTSPVKEAPGLIVWNHRWEHDKNPKLFFAALKRLKEKGVKFRLALLGERYPLIPDEFVQAKDLFRDELVAYDFIRSKPAYYRWLEKGQIIVSTAVQENFGISTVEAVRCGAVPVAPKRLSYPEIIPERFHKHCLYYRLPQLVAKMEKLLTDPELCQSLSRELSAEMARYSWENMIHAYDREFEKTFQFSTDSP